jgi:rRNA maturation endonuclease Nob1
VFLVAVYLGIHGGSVPDPTFTVLVVMGTSIDLLIISSIARTKKLEVARLRPQCKNCGTIMVLEDAEFCPNCGSRIEPFTSSRITISEQEAKTQPTAHKAPKTRPVGTCLICDLEINSNDILAGCPHCGNVFHKVHLVQWLHMKKSCPACGKHLDENQIVNKLPRASGKQRARGKK